MPRFEQLLRILLHDPGIALDTFFMESWLYCVTLLAMLFAIYGQQSLARKASVVSIVIPLKHAAVSKIARVLHQHVAHMFRAEQ